MGMKPIIFSTDMIKAILDGRKNITRRVIKPQPNDAGMLPATNWRGEPEEINVHDKGLAPYSPGDILWVRETWCRLYALDGNEQPIDDTEKYYYAADGCNPTPFNYFPDENGYNGDRGCPRWKPSIHMPRAAARIFLRVTDVNVQKIQDITPYSTSCEGVFMVNEFHHLWDSLYSKRGYGWDVNPWVWVYEFERIDDK